MNKQIEEMAFTDVDILANDINQHCADLAENYCGDTHCVSCLANALYNAGYRKQREGEWVTDTENKISMVTECSVCKHDFWFMKKGQLNIDRMPYCPNCGAKMKNATDNNVGHK